jgi:hydroxymethylglutaryl-CoA lyase
VVLVAAATGDYCRANLKCSVDEVLDSFAFIAARGREDEIRVRANVSTVFGNPFEGDTNPGQMLSW